MKPTIFRLREDLNGVKGNLSNRFKIIIHNVKNISFSNFAIYFANTSSSFRFPLEWSAEQSQFVVKQEKGALTFD